MTNEEIKHIVRAAVYETLSGLGMDTHEQHELQADFIYIRKMRKGSEAINRSVRTTAVTVIIPTLLYILWQAVKGEVWR